MFFPHLLAYRCANGHRFLGVPHEAGTEAMSAPAALPMQEPQQEFSAVPASWKDESIHVALEPDPLRSRRPVRRRQQQDAADIVAFVDATGSKRL
ncbi:MAG: hypothetical protein JO041_13800 [Acidobacteria bacterium]|nr:hypothetical protein [Acidobacteriota bacterium]